MLLVWQREWRSALDSSASQGSEKPVFLKKAQPTWFFGLCWIFGFFLFERAVGKLFSTKNLLSYVMSGLADI